VTHIIQRRFLFPAALLLAAGCAVNPGGPNATASPAVEGAAPAGTADGSAKGAGHYLGADRPERMLKLELRLTDGGVQVLGRVEAPNTINRRSPDEKRPTFFRAVNARGDVLLERGFRMEREVRSETQGENGQIEGKRVEVEEPEFTVSVPLFDDLDAIRFYEAGPDGDRARAALLGEVRP
jgi:hypothetical protein